MIRSALGHGATGANLGRLVSLALLAVAVSYASPATADAAKSFGGFLGGPALISTISGDFAPGAWDVAVYTAGTAGTSDDKLFVAEGAAQDSRVMRLDRHGNFELVWGRDVIRPGFPGNTGQGFEICRAAVTGAAGCKGGDESGFASGELSLSRSVAVNQSTGQVYVMDAGNRRVQQFDLDGNFVRAWGWNVAPQGAPGDTGDDGFEICTSSCQGGQTAGSGSQAGQFGDIGQLTRSTSSIAVSPLAPHYVFATDPGNRRVLQFQANGSFVRGWGFDVSPGGAVQFEACETTAPGCQAGATPGGADGQFAPDFPRHIALDADGIVYASDSTGDNRIVRFDSDLAPAPATAVDVDALPSVGVLGNGGTTGLEIDPDSGNLLVVRDRSTGGKTLADVREIADPGAELVPGGPPNPTLLDNHVVVDESDDAAGEPAKGLGFDPANGNIYLGAGLHSTSTPSGKLVDCVGPTSFCAGLVVLAVPTGPVGVSIAPPPAVGATTATLQGTVDAGGGAAKFRFQVSSDGASWVDAATPRYVTGSSTEAVSVPVSGLEPATLYRVRLVASKHVDVDEVESAVSAENVFLTDAKAPKVQTLGSSRRTDTSVSLRGLVDAEGSPTNYRFEYGPAGGSFDHHVPVPDAEGGSGNSSQLQVQDVADLVPDTAYHYRIVATNSAGTAVGEPVTFRTKPAEPLPEPPDGRGYELVSPPDKLSGVGIGIWYQGPSTSALAGIPAREGDRFVVQSTFGSVLSEGDFEFAEDSVLAERTPQGWVSKSSASRRAHGNHTLVFLDLVAATPDLSELAFMDTGLKLFAEQEDWIKEDAGGVLYMRDWQSGKWELFGPTEGTQEGNFQAPMITDDGKTMVAFSATRGLLGAGDPTVGLPTGVTNVFVDELPDTPSDVFPGAGERAIANVCTPGTQIPLRVDVGGTFKQGAQACTDSLISQQGATLGADTDGVVTGDGSRMFFMSPTTGSSCTGTGPGTACPPQLYVRQRIDEDTVMTRWISQTEVTQSNGASADQDALLVGQVDFEGASEDGDKVFFTTPSPLTADDPNGLGQAPAGGVVSGAASQASWDLYMYDMPDAPGADPADGELTRISAGPSGSGDCNSISGAGSESIGSLRYVSDDGSQLYFACSGPLEGVPLPDDGTITSAGGSPSDADAVNLYAYDASKPAVQRWRFVARLPRTTPLGGCASQSVRPGNPISMANNQSPTLLIESFSCVRGNSDGSFVTLFTDGRLTADDPDASSGDIYAYDAVQDELTRITAPQGGVGGTYPCLVNPSGPRCYGDDGIGPAVILRHPKLGVAETPDGSQTVFFESRSRLIPADRDAAYDVYQWRDGELSLISTGNSDTDGAFYAGSDRTGQNVYIATRDRLTWQDRDAVLDVYTARVGGGIPQPDPTDETCDPTADQCQGPGQSPGGSQTDSDAPAGGNPPTPARVALTLSDPSAKARRRAARTGRLSLRLTATGPARITLSTRAKLGRRTAKAAPTVDRALEAGTTTVRLRLTKAIRNKLRKGRRVPITITAKAGGARSVTAAFALRRNP
jgi:hypothetical protein